MKKIIILLIILLNLSSCTKNTIPQEIPRSDSYKYVISNINDDQSRADIKDIMVKSGLSNENISRFFDQVEFFNQNIDENLLINESYLKDNKIPDYDVYAMQDQMFEKFPEFPGINCRITTFGLISNLVNIDETTDENEITTIDNASFTNPPVETLEAGEIGKFNSFYRPFKINNPGDLTKNKFEISEFLKYSLGDLASKNFSLISVFVPTNAGPDSNELFVGHTGLLFNLPDGRLMLVEKLAFTAPYQAISFKTRDDLRDYLMELYDSSTSDYPIKPIIFENGKELK